MTLPLTQQWSETFDMIATFPPPNPVNDPIASQLSSPLVHSATSSIVTPPKAEPSKDVLEVSKQALLALEDLKSSLPTQKDLEELTQKTANLVEIVKPLYKHSIAIHGAFLQHMNVPSGRAPKYRGITRQKSGKTNVKERPGLRSSPALTCPPIEGLSAWGDDEVKVEIDPARPELIDLTESDDDI